MSEIRDYISERLVTSKERGTLEIDYELGVWNYTTTELECDSVTPTNYEYLYERYRCCEYDQKTEYIGIHGMVKTYLRGVKSANPTREDVERFLDFAEIFDPAESDRTLYKHVRSVQQPRGSKSLDEEHLEQAGDLWLRYVIERGPERQD